MTGEQAFVAHAARRRAFTVADITTYARRLPFATVPTWILHPSVTPPMLAVYVALLTFADLQTGECWPSLAAIAERASVSRATVARALDALEALGVVTRTKRHDAAGQASNRYTVAMDTATPPEGLAAPVDKLPADAPVSRTKRLTPISESASPPSQKATRNENQENKSQGNEARASAPLPLICPKHPDGNASEPCRTCGDARRAAEAFDAAEADAARARRAAERRMLDPAAVQAVADRFGGRYSAEAIRAAAEREMPENLALGLRMLAGRDDLADELARWER
ncbi:helix-turn-helix domain-containing protein [Microbacterium sp. Ag1]|uniref:helix-turn-helix domain-containing protein n=1 Tax=Microbacterium sp. Ag1 TaxID=1643443 RepID=UPI00069A2059|nr:helix-turn-helix domain-containing protein [Microbacterium sp. Ag1]